MWFLFHGKTRTQAVAGGRTFDERCPACDVHARFHEVAVTTSAGAFLVDVAAATDQAFRCGACGEVFDLRDRDDAAAAPPPTPRTGASVSRPAPPRSRTVPQPAPLPTSRTGTPIPRPAPPRDLLASLQAEAAQRDAVAAQRDAAIDAELAALKRKLGK